MDWGLSFDLDFARVWFVDLVGEEESPLLWSGQIGAFEDEASREGLAPVCPTGTVLSLFFGTQIFPKVDFSLAVQLFSLCPNR